MVEGRVLRRLIVLLVVAAAALLLGWLGDGGNDPVPPETPAPGAGVPPDAQPARVATVIDGDTVRVRVAAGTGPLEPGEHRVRLLEIDSPEVAGDRGPECGGRAAAEFTRSQLPVDATVWLETDVEDLDRFGRPLRYVWVDPETLLNEAIVERGHARAVLFQPNDRYWPRMRQAEAAAQAANAGMWGACER